MTHFVCHICLQVVTKVGFKGKTILLLTETANQNQLFESVCVCVGVCVRCVGVCVGVCV